MPEPFFEQNLMKINFSAGGQMLSWKQDRIDCMKAGFESSFEPVSEVDSRLFKPAICNRIH